MTPAARLDRPPLCRCGPGWRGCSSGGAPPPTAGGCPRPARSAPVRQRDSRSRQRRSRNIRAHPGAVRERGRPRPPRRRVETAGWGQIAASFFLLPSGAKLLYFPLEIAFIIPVLSNPELLIALLGKLLGQFVKE